MKYELTEAVRSQLISDVPLGAFLSGGIDSSLIVGIMSSISSNVETFNIGFEFSEFDESPYAKEVAKHIGTRHTSVMCTKEDTMNYIMQCSSAYTEPFADSSQIPTMLVSKIASNSVKVVLTGDAGDELFGGYNRYTHSSKYWSYIKYLPPQFKKFISHLIKSAPQFLVREALFKPLGINLSGNYNDRIKQLSDKLTSSSSQEEFFKQFLRVNPGQNLLKIFHLMIILLILSFLKVVIFLKL